MNVQAEKAIIIEQLKQVNDTTLIHAIRSLLDYALNKDSEGYSISEEQQRLVMERFEKIRSNPERMKDWEEAKNTLKAE
ncbi:MAG TPA: hypothetical protein VMW01_12150 [Williamwhitmania sp.]|nr:hypothetical protein [Williamwhitmania sp.]